MYWNADFNSAFQSFLCWTKAVSVLYFGLAYANKRCWSRSFRVAGVDLYIACEINVLVIADVYGVPKDM